MTTTSVTDDVRRLLDRLRDFRQFRIGVTEYLRVEALVAVVLPTLKPGATVRDLAGYIAPVICKSASDQQQFHDTIKTLFPEGKAVGQTSNGTDVQIDRRSYWRQRVRFYWPAFAAVAAVLGFAVWFFLTGREPVKRIEGQPIAAVPIAIWPNLSRDLFSSFTYLFLLVPLFGGILWAQSSRRRTMVLREQLLPSTSPRPTSRFGLMLDEPSPVLADVPWRTVAVGLRRHEELVTRTSLDVRRSIGATMASGGYLRLVHASRARTPEYLVFTRDTHPLSHIDDLRAEIADRLAAEQLAVERFRFWRETEILIPVRRSCASERGPAEEATSLDDLIARYPSSRIILMDDPHHLLDALTYEPQPWAEAFANWSRKVFLSNVALASDNPARVSLEHLGFEVIAVGADDAFDRVAAVFADDPRPRPPAPSTAGDAPSSSARPLAISTSTREPSDDQKRKLIRDLADHLGASGLRWLQLCAIFPRLLPKLTRYYGSNYHDAQGRRLFQLKTYLRLTQLPWFGAGRLPAWLRRALLAGTTAFPKRDAEAVIPPLPAVIAERARIDLTNRLLRDRISDPALTLDVVSHDSEVLGGKAADMLQREAKAGITPPDALIMDFLRGKPDPTDLTFLARIQRRYGDGKQLRERIGAILLGGALTLALAAFHDNIGDGLIAAVNALAAATTWATQFAAREALLQLLWLSVAACAATQLACAATWMIDASQQRSRPHWAWQYLPIAAGGLSIIALIFFELAVMSGVSSVGQQVAQQKADPGRAAALAPLKPWLTIHIAVGTCAAVALRAYVSPIFEAKTSQADVIDFLFRRSTWTPIAMFVGVWAMCWDLSGPLALEPVLPAGWLDRLQPVAALVVSCAMAVRTIEWQSRRLPDRPPGDAAACAAILDGLGRFALIAAVFSSLRLITESALQATSAEPLPVRAPVIGILPDEIAMALLMITAFSLVFWLPIWFRVWRFGKASLIPLAILVVISTGNPYRASDGYLTLLGPDLEPVVAAAVVPLYALIAAFYVALLVRLFRDRWRLSSMLETAKAWMPVLMLEVFSLGVIALSAIVLVFGASASVDLITFGMFNTIKLGNIGGSIEIRPFVVLAPALFAVHLACVWLVIRHAVVEGSDLRRGARDVLPAAAAPVILPAALVAAGALLLALTVTYAIAPGIRIDLHWLAVPFAAWVGRRFGHAGISWIAAASLLYWIGYGTGPWDKPLAPGLSILCILVAMSCAGDLDVIRGSGAGWNLMPLSLPPHLVRRLVLATVGICLISLEVAWSGLAIGWKPQDLLYVMVFLIGLSAVRPSPITTASLVVGAIAFFVLAPARTGLGDRFGDVSFYVSLLPLSPVVVASMIVVFLLATSMQHPARSPEAEFFRGQVFGQLSNPAPPMVVLLASVAVIGGLASSNYFLELVYGQLQVDIGLAVQAGLIGAAVLGWTRGARGVGLVTGLVLTVAFLVPFMANDASVLATMQHLSKGPDFRTVGLPGGLSLRYDFGYIGPALSVSLTMIVYAVTAAWLAPSPIERTATASQSA